MSENPTLTQSEYQARAKAALSDGGTRVDFDTKTISAYSSQLRLTFRPNTLRLVKIPRDGISVCSGALDRLATLARATIVKESLDKPSPDKPSPANVRFKIERDYLEAIHYTAEVVEHTHERLVLKHTRSAYNTTVNISRNLSSFHVKGSLYLTGAEQSAFNAFIAKFCAGDYDIH